MHNALRTVYLVSCVGKEKIVSRSCPRLICFSSPIDKIRKSGLWLVNELYKEPLSADRECLQARVRED